MDAVSRICAALPSTKKGSSVARQRLLEQITTDLPNTSLPDLRLECDEHLDEVSRETSSPPSPGFLKSLRRYDYSPADLCQSVRDCLLDLVSWQAFMTRVSPLTRAILLDWLCEVCRDYGLKRETYYLSAHFVTRFLINIDVPKRDLQLVAVTALSLAAKAEEEVVPKLAQLGRSCSGAFTPIQIKAMEQKMLSVFGWKLYTFTAANLLQWMMTRWDEFVTRTFSSGYRFIGEENWVCFCDWNQSAKRRLQESFWVLDLMQLHPEVLMHDSVLVTAALMYLLVCHYFQTSNYLLIRSACCSDPESSEDTLCAHVHSLFTQFFRETLDQPIEVLYSELQFLDPFFKALKDCNLPVTLASDADEREKMVWGTRQMHYNFTLQYISILIKSA